VWQTALPSYRLEYGLENQPDGKVVVKGTLFQENAPEDWVMPLPLVFKFAGDKVARGTVLAKGPQQPVSVSLPMRPDSVELDPDFWVLRKDFNKETLIRPAHPDECEQSRVRFIPKDER